MKGMSSHPLRGVYNNMMRRCYDPCREFEYYGGRGIGVCAEWMEDRDSFYLWALPLWSPGLQIDRIDNDRGYSPGNCRFVTPLVNSHNKRGVGVLLKDPETPQNIIFDYLLGINISRTAKKYGISRPTVYSILKKAGVLQNKQFQNEIVVSK